MGYQIRHKEFGVYQGSCMGLGFWYPLSEMPEQGYCLFPTKDDAEAYIEYLCSPGCDRPLYKNDITIEPFNKAESDLLMMTVTKVHA